MNQETYEQERAKLVKLIDFLKDYVLPDHEAVSSEYGYNDAWISDLQGAYEHMQKAKRLLEQRGA